MTTELPALLGGLPVRPSGPQPWPAEGSPALAGLLAAVSDGSWGKYHGPHVPELARLLASYHNLLHAVPCSSGTAAMELALRGVGVGAGDEVVLAAYDFRANCQNVLHLGAVPVLVDVREDNAQIDAQRVEDAMGPKTRAMIVSHLHGGVPQMPALREIADRRGVALIEDAAQAPGARIHGRVAGTWADAAILSFGGSKLVTSGRGGAVLTAAEAVAQRIRRYTQRGNEAYPLSELQAAAIIPQWQALDAANARRRESAAWLVKHLAPLGMLEAFRNPPSDSLPGYYKLGFFYRAEACGGLPRELFCAAARAEGIAIDPGFAPLHSSHASRRYRAAGGLPRAGSAGATVVTLHHPVLLGGPADLEQVVLACQKVQRHAALLAVKLASGQPPGTAQRQRADS